MIVMVWYLVDSGRPLVGLAGQSYLNWMLRMADVSSATIGYTMRESRMGLHTGRPGATPIPPGADHPDSESIDPASGSPAGVDVLSGVIEVAALLAAASGAPLPTTVSASSTAVLDVASTTVARPASAPSHSITSPQTKDHQSLGASDDRRSSGHRSVGTSNNDPDPSPDLEPDEVVSYSDAINTPADSLLPLAATAAELSHTAVHGGAVPDPSPPSHITPLRTSVAVADGAAWEFSGSVKTLPLTADEAGSRAPIVTTLGSVTEVSPHSGVHYGYTKVRPAVKAAIGESWLTGKGGGPESSRRAARLYRAAHAGVEELWRGHDACTCGHHHHHHPTAISPLQLSPDGAQRVWRLATGAAAESKPVPSPEELGRWIAVMRQASPSALLPGVMAGPTFFRRCDEVWHPGKSCLRAHLEDVPALMLRCVRLYAPVHTIPVVLFRWRDLLSQPVDSVVRVVKSVAQSSLFLSAYVTMVKSTLCALRNLRHEDAAWHAAAAGLISGSALLFEQGKRASELMLYCMPKGIEVAFQLLERAGLVVRVQGGDVIMFCAAMGVILALDREDFRPAYAAFLNILFGTDQARFHQPPRSPAAALVRRS